MRQEKAGKIKLVKILEILRQDSDEDHYVTSKHLLERLNKMDIDCDRRTLYADIDVLNDFGYEVICEKESGMPNKYCIINRNFSIPEIKVLIDAVQASSFITQKKTDELIDKLTDLGGSYRKKLLQNNSISYNTTKHSNEQIYYIVEQIENAIEEKKQVSFFYFDYNEKIEKVFRKNKERYIVNPVSMLISTDNYYLVAYNAEKDKMYHYRLDRMMNLSIEKTNVLLPDWIDKFDLKKHKHQVFGMFVGEEKEVVLEFEPSIIDAIIDRFGEDIKITKQSNGKMSLKTIIQDSPQFISWVCMFGDKLKVLEPCDVVGKINSHIREMIKLYNE